jgi:prepilin-type N-terminal cleavage/methylation domain-containing protein/prepilin-type processing-associated H-X9-DG protein
MTGSASNLRGGFTLVELLAAIAIIIILAALLFPLAQMAIGKSQQAICLGNMRTISGWIMAYTADRNGAYPPSNDCACYSYGPMGGAPSRYCWDEKMVIDGIITKADLKITRHGCPANGKILTQGCYGFNYEQLGNENTGFPQLPRIAAVEQPSKTVMLMDNFPGGNGKGWSLLPYWQGTDKKAKQPLGHLGNVNVVWADGHATTTTMKALYNHDPMNGVQTDPTGQLPPWYFARKKK